MGPGHHGGLACPQDCMGAKDSSSKRAAAEHQHTAHAAASSSHLSMALTASRRWRSAAAVLTFSLTFVPPCAFPAAAAASCNGPDDLAGLLLGGTSRY